MLNLAKYGSRPMNILGNGRNVGASLVAGHFRGYRGCNVIPNKTQINIFNNYSMPNQNYGYYDNSLSKGEKWILGIGGAVTGLGVISGLFNAIMTIFKKEPETVTEPPENENPTVPENPETPSETETPAANPFSLDVKSFVEKAKQPKTYTVAYRNYPSGIITGKYGVAYGSPEYKAIMKAVYEANGYETGKNISVGDVFVLPDVEFNGKTYSADKPDSNVPTGVVGNNLEFAKLKPVTVAKDSTKWYIVGSDGKKYNNDVYNTEQEARTAMATILKSHTEE